MDSLLSYVPEALAALGALWAFRGRAKANKRAAAEAAARAVLETRMAAVSDIGVRFADALARRDLPAMRAIERERKERGL